MRRLLFFVLTAALLYAGYWGVGRLSLGKMLDQVAASEAVSLTYDTRRISGFPSRFDTTFEELAIETPEVSWRTPLAQVFALAYRPTHVIAYLPGPHDLMIQGQPLHIETADARASLRSAARTSLPLQAAILDVQAPILTAEAGQARATRGLASLTAAEAEATYVGHLEVTELRINTIAPMTLRAATELRFDRVLDRTAAQARLQDLTLTELRIESGAQAITATGALSFDAMGVANGQITVASEDWRGAVTQMQTAGLITPDQQTNLTSLLGGMAQGDSLSMPLSVRNGVVIAGFVPVAQIPPLYRQ